MCTNTHADDARTTFKHIHFDRPLFALFIHCAFRFRWNFNTLSAIEKDLSFQHFILKVHAQSPIVWFPFEISFFIRITVFIFLITFVWIWIEIDWFTKFSCQNDQQTVSFGVHCVCMHGFSIENTPATVRRLSLYLSLSFWNIVYSIKVLHASKLWNFFRRK